MSDLLRSDVVTLLLGQTGNVPFEAYGDESHFRDALVYSYVIAEKSRLAKIKLDLDALKLRFKIPLAKELHCRLLCSPNGRKQGGFDFLDKEAVEKLIYEVFELMADNNIAIRFAITDYRHHRDQYGDNMKMQTLEGQKSTIKVHRLRSGEIDPKAIYGSLSGQIWADGLIGNSSPTAKECDIYVSADPSVVKFLGDKHKAAHDHFSLFLDINAPPGHVYKIQPFVTTYEQSFMVQLADIVAFTCSHSASPDKHMDFYRGLLRIYKNAICFPHQMVYDPNLIHE